MAVGKIPDENISYDVIDAGKFTIVNPYLKTRANTYKGQLHCHTTNSDGVNTPLALENSYDVAGFDFVVITDHDYLTTNPSSNIPLHIDGIEETTNDPGIHLDSTKYTHFISIDPDSNAGQYSPQETVDDIIAKNGLPGLTHPNASTAEGYHGVSGYHLVDIWNGRLQTLIGDGLQQDEVIELLNNDHVVYPVAVDDCHNSATAIEFNRGYIMVHADSLTLTNIIQSLREGTYYSCYAATTPGSAPNITVSQSGKTITATTAASSTITWLTKGGTAQSTPNVTTDSYTIQGDEKYVLIKITRASDSAICWSNPIWVHKEPNETIVGGGRVKHSISLAKDLYFYGKQANRMSIHQGSKIPSTGPTPVTGQQYFHTPTGRLILLTYNGTNWISTQSFGDVTIYVDGASGSDSIDKGYGTGSNAYATLQYAINNLPPLLTGDVTINVSAATYAEIVNIRGKYLSGNYYLTIKGTHGTSDVVGTASGGGADSDTEYLDDSSKSWTTNQWANYFVELTGGTGVGQTRLIESNTVTRLRIVGYFNPDPDVTTTYKIYKPATTIQRIVPGFGQVQLVLRDLILGSLTDIYSLNMAIYSRVQIYNSLVYANSPACNNEGDLIAYATLFAAKGSAYTSEFTGARCVSYYSRFDRQSGTGSAANIIIKSGSFFYGILGTVISNSLGDGLYLTNNATLQLHWDSVVGNRCRIYSNAGYGIRTEKGSMAIECDHQYYNANISGNYSGDATTYAYAGA